MRQILFVCTGNICRSPMAEGYLRHLLQDGKLGEIIVQSAGIGALSGQPPSQHAVEAMAEKQISIQAQRSKMIDADLVASSDAIYGMTQGHVNAVIEMFPRAAEKTFLVRAHVEDMDRYQMQISDPIGGNLHVYRACRDEIIQGIDAMHQHMLKQSKASSPSLRLAIGSDHAGWNAKKHILQACLQSGHQVTDLGTLSQDSTDYPDYALAVSRAVAQGRADFGILICASGVGMSIAANKVPGIRAALVADTTTAKLCREHNHANVLCLGANHREPSSLQECVEAFLAATPGGSRHQRRVDKITAMELNQNQTVQAVDPAIAKIIEQEKQRQQQNIELIASENFTSPAVMEVQGSVLTNKYAEGYPQKRWYGGCEFVDEAETLAIERAKSLFGAPHANVQPHSGSGANMAVYFSVLQPGDKILTMDLSHGGHLTHGNKANFSGKFFDVVHYGVSEQDERIDYDQLEALAREHRPKMITVGASAYPRIIDFARMGAIAREVGAYMLADIAHIAGLVASGVHPSPVGHAHFVTTTTHKTLRGPRGGLILCEEEFAKQIDSQAFPGIQGGPLMHVIAAKAVCFEEALQPSFRAYQQQVVRNAAALAEGLNANGFRLVSGGTENHLMLVDVGRRELTGKQCQHALDEAGITVNKNTIPFETRSPFQASGIRIGTPAVTTRGMNEGDMQQIADMISEVILNINKVDVARAVRQRVNELTARYPLPY